MFKLKQYYLEFLERDKKNFLELGFYFLLYFLSFIYGAGVCLRNFLYNNRLISSYSSQSKVISVGGLCWSGSGKTSLTIWLAKKLSCQFKTAILRRGYGRDEEILIKEYRQTVFSDPDRSRLVKKFQSQFDVFILDDGFQYRRLRRDIDIVMMGAREFKKKHRLIPAYFFREPLKVLKRADIVIVNYTHELLNRFKIEQCIKQVAPQCEIYFSYYQVKQFLDLTGKSIDISTLRNKKIAAFAAIGYPQGFFNKLRGLDMNLVCEITYPDHYELSKTEFDRIQDDLKTSGITDLVITSKDKYHLPLALAKLNIFIMEVEIEIEDEGNFLQTIEKKLRNKNK